MMEGQNVKEACIFQLQKLNNLSDAVHQHYFINANKQIYKHKQSLIPIYTFVYEMCTMKPSYDSKMLQLFKAALQSHIVKYMEELNAGVKSRKLIQTYNRIWVSYLAFAQILTKRIFNYLDRYFLQGEPPLIEIAFQVFRQTFFTKSSLPPFFDSYIHLINKSRESRIISNDEGLKFSQSLATIALNLLLFPTLQQIYLREASKFYETIFEKNKGEDPMSYINLVNNLTYFEKLLQKKSIRLDLQVLKYLNPNQIATFKNAQPEGQACLFKLFQQLLVINYTDQFIRHPYGYSFLLRNQQIDNLKIVYQVYSVYEGFEKLRNALYEFVINEGEIRLRNLSQTDDEGDRFISAFYEFYNQYSRVVTQSFNKNEEMLVSLNNGIQKLAGKFENMSLMLFKYTRSILDKGRFEEQKEKITTIFEKLSYKDEFLNLYKDSLEKKLINGKLVYMLEKKFIQAMNKICGSDVTAHLDKKLQDFIQSMPEDLIVGKQKQSFDVKVVSLQLWEKNFKDQMTLNLTLIDPIKETWDNFEKVYCERFPKRKLTLLPFENKLILSININSIQRLRLKCNLIQAIVLIYASHHKQSISEEKIINELTIQKTFLHSFLEEIPKIMIQQNPGIYKFNWQYSSSQTMIDLDSKTQEQKKVTNNIQQDRKILIEAAIVKILKRQKQLSFEELVKEVCKRIKLFKPHPSSIKISCDSLMKKVFICEEEGFIKYMQ